MAKPKAKKKPADDPRFSDVDASKAPAITITSLNSTSLNRDFDYFPNLKSNGLPTDQQEIVSQLKNGTYQPLMAAVEYDVQIEKTKHYLVTGKPVQGLFASTKLDTFDYTKQLNEVFSAATMKTKPNSPSRLEILEKSLGGDKNTPITPRYYHNPLQYFDHILLADAYTNSFAGTVIDELADFIMPKNLKPTLILRNPDSHGTPEEQQKVIEENQEIIEKLQEVDKWYSDDGPKEVDSYIEFPLMAKFKSAIIHYLTFGRDAILFERWTNLPHFVDSEGTKYEEIPNAIKVVHPIDMGMIEIDPYTWKLGGIYMHNTYPFIKASDMVYLVHKYNSPLIGSMFYGFSHIQRAIDPVRLLRRIFAQNYPQFIRTSHSGMGAFLFDSTQYPEEVRLAIRTKILNSYKAGEIAIIDYANIKDFEFKEFKINPEIGALIQLQESLIKVIVAIMGIPQSLIFDEGQATRATLVGKIISFINQNITQLRSEIGTQLATQWYMRNFRILYKSDEKKLKMFSIGVEFEEMDLETKTEKVERLLMEMQLNPYKDEHIGEELNDPSYLDNIDKDKRDQQMQMNQGMGGFGNKMPIKPTGNKGVYKVDDADTGKSAFVHKA